MNVEQTGSQTGVGLGWGGGVIFGSTQGSAEKVAQGAIAPEIF